VTGLAVVVTITTSHSRAGCSSSCRLFDTSRGTPSLRSSSSATASRSCPPPSRAARRSRCCCRRRSLRVSLAVTFVVWVANKVALRMQLLLLPRLMSAIGEARSCAAGLVVLAAALASSARVRTLPLHALLFLAARAGLAVAETANVALTARHSRPAERGPNLAYLQSFQAGCCGSQTTYSPSPSAASMARPAHSPSSAPRCSRCSPRLCRCCFSDGPRAASGRHVVK